MCVGGGGGQMCFECIMKVFLSQNSIIMYALLIVQNARGQLCHDNSLIPSSTKPRLVPDQKRMLICIIK